MKIGRIVLIAVVFILPSVVVAAGLVPCDGVAGLDKKGVVCNFCSLMQLAQNIVNYIIILSASIGAIMFAYAGVLYVTNGGDTTKVTKAHGIFTSVFYGIVIILVAWLLVDVLIKTLANESLGPWNKIECSSGRTGAFEG